jgi:hypothetical protein
VPWRRLGRAPRQPECVAVSLTPAAWSTIAGLLWDAARSPRRSLARRGELLAARRAIVDELAPVWSTPRARVAAYGRVNAAAVAADSCPTGGALDSDGYVCAERRRGLA